MTIISLVLLPLFLTASVALVMLGRVYLFYTETQMQCRDGLLRSQEIQLPHFNRLLSLNNKASALRAEFKQAVAEVNSAKSVPILMPAAAAHLSSVIQRQLLLQKVQVSVHQTGIKQSQLGLERTRFKLNAVDITEMSKAKLDLVRTPPASLTPNYEPGLNFAKRQAYVASWRVSVRKILPLWVENYLGRYSDLWLEGHCGATLTERSHRWVSELKGDRSWWKY